MEATFGSDLSPLYGGDVGAGTEAAALSWVERYKLLAQTSKEKNLNFRILIIGK